MRTKKGRTQFSQNSSNNREIEMSQDSTIMPINDGSRVSSIGTLLNQRAT